MPRRGKKSKAAKQRESVKGYSDPQAHGSLEHRNDQSNSNIIMCVKKVVSGTLHQGDTLFLFPGIQCTYISFLSLVFMTIKEPKSWTYKDIDACVFDGNSKFIGHCRERDMEPKMLMANELPEFISYFGKEFICKRSDSQIQVGLLKPSKDNMKEGEIQSICNGLTEVFNYTDSCLLICGGQTVAIAKHEDHFYAFDPHSRGKDGLLNPVGNAVLIMFATLDELIVHFEKLLLDSLKLQWSQQFELVPVSISENPSESTSNVSTTSTLILNRKHVEYKQPSPEIIQTSKKQRKKQQQI